MMWTSVVFLNILLLITSNRFCCGKEIYDDIICISLMKLPVQFSKWTPEDQTRTDLLCPELNQHINVTKEKYAKKVLCSCCSIPSWKYDNIPIGNLHFEYFKKRGESFLLENDHKTPLHRIENENGYLSALPVNFCQFPTIVEVLLKGNLIKKLPSLTCLIELDKIDLSYNQLTFISNTTFSGLRKLRRIDFSHNLIAEIQPFTFNHYDNGIMMADFSFNKLSSLDITNVFVLSSFCFESYENNQISRITNRLNYQVQPNQTFGFGGYINMARNNIERLPDPAGFGMSMTELGKFCFDKFTLDLSYNKLLCDCGMEAFLRQALDVIGRYKIAGQQLGLYCHSPSNMRENKSIPDLLSTEYLDRLICNATNSPKDCQTYFQPSQRKIVINCTSAGLSTIPELNMKEFQKTLPYEETKNDFLNSTVFAIFSNNSIKTFSNTSYMTKISLIDLSINDLDTLRISALLSLRMDTEIDISYNQKLRFLPRHLQRMKSENIRMLGLNLSCTCDDEMYKWLPEWIPRNSSYVLPCNTGNEVLSTRTISAKVLGCILYDIDFVLSAVVPLLVATALITAAFLVSYVYRYEIYVLYRHSRQKGKSDNYSYDIYISFDESHSPLTRWLITTFLPVLHDRGYKTYIPFRDALPGEFKEEQIMNAMNSSVCTIIFLTQSIIGEDDVWVDVEWRNAWKHYKSDFSSKLIVVNFDLVQVGTIPSLPIQAILRLQYVQYATQFSSTSFITNVIKTIGSPMQKRIQNENKKPKFDVRQLGTKLFSSKTDLL